MRAHPKVAILAYHKIGSPPAGHDSWFYVPEQTFAEQLDTLAETGWPVIDLATFLAGLDTPSSLPDRSALITFDDGCRTFAGAALEALTVRRYASVQFVPTGFIGRTNGWDAGLEPEEAICDWNELRELQAAGVDVEAHSVSHPHFSALDATSLERELRESKAALQSGLARAVHTFAYPFGDPGADVVQVDTIMSALGYKAAFLYDGGVLDLATFERYRLPRIPMGPDTDLRSELARAECDATA